MKQTLAALSVGALVCLPCLLVAGAAGIAAGGASLALVGAPVARGAGLVVLMVATTLAWRRWRPAACGIEGGPGSGEGVSEARLAAPSEHQRQHG